MVKRKFALIKADDVLFSMLDNPDSGKDKSPLIGIWKVLSMFFYLSNRFTNHIMFGIILKSFLSSMLWHKFYEDIIKQTRKISL